MKEKSRHWINGLYSALVVIFFASLPFERIPTLEVHGFTVKISYLLGLILIAVSLSALWRLPFRKSDLTLGTFWLIGLVSSFLAADRGRAIVTLCLWLFAFFVYRVLGNRINDNLRSKIENVLIWVSLAIALFGLYQFIGDSLGLTTAATGLRERYTTPVLGFPRVQSVSLEPLYYANFLLVPILLLIKRYLTQNRFWNKYFWLLIVILASFILTVSRGAYIALAVGTLLFLVYYLALYRDGQAKRLWGLALSLVFAIAVSTALIATLNGYRNLSRFSDHVTVQDATNQASVEGRTQGYQIAWNKFTSHPVLGVGPGNSGLLAQPIVDHGEVFNYGSLNNIYLEIMAETGAFGTILFALFLIFTIAEGAAIFRSLRADARLGMIAVACGLVAIFIQYNFFSTLYIIYIWAFLALLKSYGTANQEDI